MDHFFAAFGKGVLVVIILGLLAGGGYYFGKYGKPIPQASPTPTATETNSPPATKTPTQAPQTPAATPKTVSAGVSSGLSFSRYSIQVPADWTATHTSENIGTPVDTVRIAKGSYTISIYQAATGGAPCIYPGTPTPEGPASLYTEYIEFSAGTVIFRRSTSPATTPSSTEGFTICQKSSDVFGAPTMFGHISYTVPVSPDADTLKAMDAIVSSIRKI